jgi:lysozyme
MRQSLIAPLKVALVTLLVLGALAGLGLSVYTSAGSAIDDPLLPVKGVDLSSHNGDVDFARLADQGISFAILKATEGATFKDPAFVDNYRQARQAGMMVGAYHFFRFETSGYMQAINLLNSVRGRDIDFPLVIDIEEWGNPHSRPTGQIIAELKTMISHVKQAGYGVMLYTNKDGYARFLDDELRLLPLWICSFTDTSLEMRWTLWQYSHSGDIDGVYGKVDLNTFAGTPEAFELWLDRYRQPIQY